MFLNKLFCNESTRSENVDLLACISNRKGIIQIWKFTQTSIHK